MSQQKNQIMEKIISLCKRRGFVYPSSEIYGGFANAYTFGPLGAEMRKNIKDLWWQHFVRNQEDIVGIDGGIILHPKTWHASGHVGGFNDPMIDCRTCKARHRADHLIEDACSDDLSKFGVETVDGVPVEKLTSIVQENNLKCPNCGSEDLTEVRQFNLMFSTKMSKTAGEASDSYDPSIAYLRPETAQAMFLEFKSITDSTRVKVPFGIAQIGKAFRNEITPGNFIFRVLEFEQMEIEYFVAEEDWEKHFDAWIKKMHTWCDMIGLTPEKVHELNVPEESRAHYSKRTIDFEYDFPFGKKELYGCAYRTNYDLENHQKESGKDLQYRDPQTNEKYLPHVIEPTFGVERTFLAALCDAYTEEDLGEQGTRVVLRLKPAIAPVKIAVFPLMKKDGLPEKSREILQKLQIFGNVEYDDGGAIGKRYRRHDEIGTPVCITIDYESLEDQAVTVRDRDSMEQQRIKITELVGYLSQRYF